jgi:hypothetical protein
MVVTHAASRHALVRRAAANCNPAATRGLPGSTDVICGIRATGRRVRPQTIWPSSTVHRGVNFCQENKPESDCGWRACRDSRARSAAIVNLAGPVLGDVACRAWETCRFSMGRPLAGAAGLRHNSERSPIPGGRCSQGGVKFPTGGKGGQDPSPRAPSSANSFLELPGGRVSRFGATPKPTVKVRMKENGCDSR